MPVTSYVPLKSLNGLDVSRDTHLRGDLRVDGNVYFGSSSDTSGTVTLPEQTFIRVDSSNILLKDYIDEQTHGDAFDTLTIKGLVDSSYGKNYTFHTEYVDGTGESMDQLVLKKGTETLMTVSSENVDGTVSEQVVTFSRPVDFNNNVNVGDNIIMNANNGVIIANGFQFTGKPAVPTITFMLNGELTTVTNPDPTMSLSQYLRRHTPYTGTKVNCAQGGCGVCAVMISYKDLADNSIRNVSVNSCLMLLVNCDNKVVTTTEGIGGRKKGYHPVQERIAKTHGLQCGACTAGQVMTQYVALQPGNFMQKNDYFSLVKNFDGNICRCSSYLGILKMAKSFLPLYQLKYGGGNAITGYCLTDNFYTDASGNWTDSSRNPSTVPVFKPTDSSGNPIEESDIAREGLSFYGVLDTSSNGYTKPYPSIYGFYDNNKAFKTYDSTKDINGSSADNLAFLNQTPATSNLEFTSPVTGLKYLKVYTLSSLANNIVNYGLGNVQLVASATSYGVPSYDVDHTKVSLDVNGVPELYAVDTSSSGVGFTFGANVPINKVVRLFTDSSSDQKLSAMGDHLYYIAGNHVRNAGSIMGGVAMAKRYGFSGDVAPLLIAAGATLKLLYVYANGRTSTVTDIKVEDYLADNEPNKFTVIVSVTIPKRRATEFFWSTRVAIRDFNSHAMVNCAMSYDVNGGGLISNSKIVYGALGGGETNNGRLPKIATNTMAALNGTAVTVSAINTLLNTLFTTLAAEVSVTPMSAYMSTRYPDAKTGYRNQLIKNFLYMSLIKLLMYNSVAVNSNITSSVYDWLHKTKHGYPNNDFEYTLEDQSKTIGLYPVHFSVPEDAEISIPSGEMQYTDDIKPEAGELFLSPALNKTCAFGKVNWTSPKTINALAAARSVPGVYGVYTALDFSSNKVANMRYLVSVGAVLPQGALSNNEILGDVAITNYGFPVAVVASEDEQLAEFVAQSIELDYYVYDSSGNASVDAAIAKGQLGPTSENGFGIPFDVHYISQNFNNYQTNMKQGFGFPETYVFDRAANAELTAGVGGGVFVDGSGGAGCGNNQLYNKPNYSDSTGNAKYYQFAYVHPTNGYTTLPSLGSFIETSGNLVNYTTATSGDASGDLVWNNSVVDKFVTLNLWGDQSRSDTSAGSAPNPIWIKNVYPLVRHLKTTKVSPYVVTLPTVYSGHVHHFYMERQTAFCRIAENKKYQLHAAVQDAGATKTTLLQSFPQLNRSDVEVVVHRVGGGFGGKFGIHQTWYMIPFFVTYITGRPSRLVTPLEADMCSQGAVPEVRNNVVAGFDASGKILSLNMKVYQATYSGSPFAFKDNVVNPNLANGSGPSIIDFVPNLIGPPAAAFNTVFGQPANTGPFYVNALANNIYPNNEPFAFGGSTYDFFGDFSLEQAMMVYLRMANNISNINIDAKLALNVAGPHTTSMRSFGQIDGSLQYTRTMDAVVGELAALGKALSYEQVELANIGYDKLNKDLDFPYDASGINILISMFGRLMSDEFNYTARKEAITAFNTANKFVKRGLAINKHLYGSWKYFSDSKDPTVKLKADGFINVWPCIADMGQGAHPKMAQTLSNILMVPASQINFQTHSTELSEGDTIDGGSTGSQIAVWCMQQIAKKFTETLKTGYDSSYNLIYPARDSSGRTPWPIVSGYHLTQYRNLLDASGNKVQNNNATPTRPYPGNGVGNYVYEYFDNSGNSMIATDTSSNIGICNQKFTYQQVNAPWSSIDASGFTYSRYKDCSGNILAPAFFSLGLAADASPNGFGGIGFYTDTSQNMKYQYVEFVNGKRFNLKEDLLANDPKSWKQLMCVFRSAPDAYWYSFTENNFTLSCNQNGLFNQTYDISASIVPYFCSMSEVEVNILTGKTKVVEVDILYDVGSSTNPAIDFGQLEGGYIFQMGKILTEERLFDTNRHLLTLDTWEYKPPLMVDLPDVMKIKFFRNNPNAFDPNDSNANFLPWGSKQCQEMGVLTTNSTYAAILQAVRAFRTQESGLSPVFSLDLPASGPRIQAAAGLSTSFLQLS